MFAGASLTGGGVAPPPRGPLQRPMRESNSTMTKEEAEDLARVEEEGEGQVAVRTRGTYEEKKETRGKIKRKPWYIIDPRTSKFMGYWDAISMVSYAPAIETASQQPELASCARHCGSAHEGLPSSGSPHAASTDSANGWLATAPALHARAPSVSPVWLLHACRRQLSCSRPSSPLSR
jgi:hypothetical protein